MNQGSTLVSQLPATSWHLQSQRDAHCSDVLARHKSRHHMTCKVLQAFPIRKTTQAAIRSRTSKNSRSSAMAKVCVNFIGPYTLKGLDGKNMEFVCLTITDPATGCFEMVGLLAIIKMVAKKGKVTEEVVIDKSSTIKVAMLLN